MHKLNKSLEKAAEFLVNTQTKEGNWEKDKSLHNEPSVYMTDLVLTSEALNGLMFIKDPKYLESIRKALYYTSEYELEANSNVVLWAWKLLALKNSNTSFINSLNKQAQEILIKNQKNGMWPTFPTTSNINNFYAILSLFNTENEKTLKKSKRWFEKNMAKDENGWGIDQTAQKSETTFTSNIITSMLLAGASPKISCLQKAKKFIESTQRKSGAWASTKFTTDKETIYATTVATLSLMLLSKDPFNDKIEKGIKYILKTQKSNGSWPLIANEKKGLVYTTFFSILTLSFYKYLKENWEKEEGEIVESPEITTFLFKRFLRESNKNLVWMSLSRMLDSKMLGSTINAVARRKDIIQVLLTKGSKDVAAIIDELKKQPKYNYLNKKHHITQIKSDVEYLRSITVVDNIHDLYFICLDFSNL